jgi:hypothetical protein
MQQRLPRKETGLAFFSAHGPVHKAGFASRLLGQPVDEPGKPHERHRTMRFLAQAGKRESVDALCIHRRLCIHRCRGTVRRIHTTRACATSAFATSQALGVHVDVPAKMPQNVR